MLMDGSYLPTIRNGKFLEDEGTIYNDLGRMEGLREKGSTIWTVSSLYCYALKDFPLPLTLWGRETTKFCVNITLVV